MPPFEMPHPNKAPEVRNGETHEKKWQKPLRQRVSDTVEKVLTGGYDLIENISIKTYNDRQKIIKHLKDFNEKLKIKYRNNVPIEWQNNINSLIRDLEDVKEGTVEGAKAAVLKIRIQQALGIRPKIKSEMEDFESQHEGELNRVNELLEANINGRNTLDDLKNNSGAVL